MRKPMIVLVGAGLLAATLVPLAPTAPAAAAQTVAIQDEPVVTPSPQQITYSGEALVLPPEVAVVASDGTDESALDELVLVLGEHDVTADVVDDVGAVSDGTLAVLLGDGSDGAVATALDAAGVELPAQQEGYGLSVRTEGEGMVALGGRDATGQFYAVQTLRQLLDQVDGETLLAAATVADHPAMPLRGTIEGFYGPPWSHEDRLDQFEFYGDLKLNTYVFAPKNDPYHREQWRDPYPADEIAEIGELTEAAAANHVRFTFALSPGESICYSSEEDFDALIAKLDQAYDAGVRSFSVPLDDITLSEWHCDGDQDAYGDPSAATHGQAQVELLNRVVEEFVDAHEDVLPLQTVPTEYNNVNESDYKQAYREGLDESIVVMWTGTATVPVHIGVDDAQGFADVFGRPAFLWDNYPVNDFKRAAGRLLLAPYQEREAGLSEVLTGVVSNPMNLAAASKVAVFTVADFAWNDAAYDAERSWSQAADYLAGGDDATAEALMTFFELNSFGPGCTPRCADADGPGWLPPAPELAAAVADFEEQWISGDRSAALDGLRPEAAAMTGAPDVIREGAVDELFVAEAEPWLQATTEWGELFDQTLDMLDRAQTGDLAAAQDTADEIEAAMREVQAHEIGTDTLRYAGLVKIADQVLDRFVVDALLRVRNWDLLEGTVRDLAAGSHVTASTSYRDQDGFRPSLAVDSTWQTRWGSDYREGQGGDDQWLQVELAEPSYVPRVEVRWEDACAADYEIQTSLDGQTWTTAATGGVATRADCSAPQVLDLDGEDPVLFVRMQGVEPVTQYGYSIYDLMPIGVPVREDLARQASAVTASSVEYDRVDFQPHYAIDGDVHTRWSSWRTDDEWIQLELDDPIVPDLARLTFEPGACAERFEIQTSDDGENWQTAAAVDETSCGTEVVELDLPHPVSFVRMQGVERASSYGYSIFTFSLFRMADIEVVPEPVVFIDEPGTENDLVTIPDVPGVEYLYDGDVLETGDHPGAGEMTITARALEGYVIPDDATTEWSHLFDTEDPTEEPTVDPTEEPTVDPTEEPSAGPTEEPTERPTEWPTGQPTERPTTDGPGSLPGGDDAPSSAGGAGEGELPSTGLTATSAVLAGLALLVSGVLVLAARRRRVS